MIDTPTTAEYGKIVKGAFIWSQNITFDRYFFLITKQLWGQFDHFYGELKELAEKRDFENKEEILIRDLFIANLIDYEIQK